MSATFWTGPGSGATLSELIVLLDKYLEGDLPDLARVTAEEARIEIMSRGWTGYEKTNIGIFSFDSRPYVSLFNDSDVARLERVLVG